MRTWMRVEEIFKTIGFDVADGLKLKTTGTPLQL